LRRHPIGLPDTGEGGVDRYHPSRPQAPEVIRVHGLLGARPFAIGELILVKVVEAFRLKLLASPAAIATVHDQSPAHQEPPGGDPQPA
jgi:hypothetical protein